LSEIVSERLDGKSVLDIACGTGKHLIGFLEKGAHVTVIDKCAEELETLVDSYDRYKDRIIAVCDDVLKWKNESKYEIVHIGDNSFQTFDSYEDQLLLTKRIADCISYEGYGLINIVALDAGNVVDYYRDDRLIKKVNHDGLDVHVYGRLSADIYRQRLTYHFTSKALSDESSIKKEHCSCRITTHSEMERYVSTAGMKIVDCSKRILASGAVSYYYKLAL